MSKLVVFMSMSLDGFVAAEGDGPGRGLGVGGDALHAWLAEGSTVSPSTFGPAGGADAEVFAEMMATGAVVTGRHTFEWAGDWGGDHHDGVPIFVLTRTEPAEPVRGLAHYLTDLPTAVARAKEAAGERDVLAHGASSVQALLRAGLVDEFAVALVPILLGRGTRLFDDPETRAPLRLLRSAEGAEVLHLRYAVEAPGAASR